MQTQTSNTLHNAIMEAGSKDRPPMLALGNYVQWKSRIKRYIDTKPNHELIHYCLENPLYELGWKDKPIPDSDGNLTTTTERVFETYKNVKQDLRDQLNAKAEAVQIILTEIDNDIYSTVDACPNAVVDLRYFNSLKLEVDSLTSQLETQRTQFVNGIDLLSREYYYADHMHAILSVYTELDEVVNMQCDYLELLKKCKGLQTELSKSKMMSKSFESVQKHDLKAQLQDKGIAINEFKKLMEKQKGKSMDTKFERSSVIRQPNAFKSQRPSILCKPTTLSNSF
nr:hypothetical protein [Tanacetum cinerariifolium]